MNKYVHFLKSILVWFLVLVSISNCTEPLVFARRVALLLCEAGTSFSRPCFSLRDGPSQACAGELLWYAGTGLSVPQPRPGSCRHTRFTQSCCFLLNSSCPGKDSCTEKMGTSCLSAVSSDSRLAQEAAAALSCHCLPYSFGT